MKLNLFAPALVYLGLIYTNFHYFIDSEFTLKDFSLDSLVLSDSSESESDLPIDAQTL